MTAEGCRVVIICDCDAAERLLYCSNTIIKHVNTTCRAGPIKQPYILSFGQILSPSCTNSFFTSFPRAHLTRKEALTSFTCNKSGEDSAECIRSHVVCILMRLLFWPTVWFLFFVFFSLCWWNDCFRQKRLPVHCFSTLSSDNKPAEREGNCPSTICLFLSACII